MNIGGALGTIGSNAIGAYPWGEMIVKICNFHLPVDKLVTATDTGDEVLGKIVGMDDSVQIVILTMDIGNPEGLTTGANRTSLMKTAAVIIALAMVVIGSFTTFMYSSEEGGMDAEVMQSIFNAGTELVKLLLGIDGA